MLNCPGHDHLGSCAPGAVSRSVVSESSRSLGPGVPVFESDGEVGLDSPSAADIDVSPSKADSSTCGNIEPSSSSDMPLNGVDDATRRRLLRDDELEVVPVGEEGDKASKPSDLRRASISLAKSAVSFPVPAAESSVSVLRLSGAAGRRSPL